MLRQRLVSGVLLAIVLVSVVLLAPHPVFAAAFALLFGIGAMEWGRLTSLGAPVSETIFIAAYCAIVALLWWERDALMAQLWLSAAAVFWLAVFFALRHYRQTPSHIPRWQRPLSLTGLLLLPAAWMAFVALHDIHPGWVLYIMMLCGLADSFAFLFGKMFGKHKLAPELSPGKTIEGAAGGLFSVLVFSLLTALFWQQFSGLQLVAFVGLSLFVGLISIEGDLFESLIKREAGEKDSGRILPGHGGILDRFDSHIAASPLFYLGLKGVLAWTQRS